MINIYCINNFDVCAHFDDYWRILLILNKSDLIEARLRDFKLNFVLAVIHLTYTRLDSPKETVLLAASREKIDPFWLDSVFSLLVNWDLEMKTSSQSLPLESSLSWGESRWIYAQDFLLTEEEIIQH